MDGPSWENLRYLYKLATCSKRWGLLVVHPIFTPAVSPNHAEEGSEIDCLLHRWMLMRISQQQPGGTHMNLLYSVSCFFVMLFSVLSFFLSLFQNPWMLLMFVTFSNSFLVEGAAKKKQEHHETTYKMMGTEKKHYTYKCWNINQTWKINRTWKQNDHEQQMKIDWLSNVPSVAKLSTLS